MASDPAAEDSAPAASHQDADFDGVLRYLLSTPQGLAFLADADRVQAVFGAQRRDQGLIRALLRMNEGIEDIRKAVLGGDVKSVMLHELKAIETSIMQMHRDLASLRPDDDGGASTRITSATEELDAIVRATETATDTILTAAEATQAIADTLPDPAKNDLSAEMGKIMEACSFQDITGQRISKVITTLHFLESRITGMLAMWDASKQGETVMPGDKRPDAHLLNGPQLEGAGNDQASVDALFG